MAIRKRLGEYLLSTKLITKEQLDQALEIQRESPAPLGRILVSLGFMTEELLLNSLAAQVGARPWHLQDTPPNREAIAKIPGPLCRTYQILPVDVRGDLLVVAMHNPNDIEAIDLIRNMTGLRVEPVLADHDRLLQAIENVHSARPTTDALDSLVSDALKDFRSNNPGKTQQRQQVLGEADTRPVVGLVNQILTDAIRMTASDVHIEPRLDRVEIRYRVDGQMQKVREIPLDLLPMLTTRLKIMAELDIVEFRVPQDGRVSVTIDGRMVDLRVSVLPNQHGQRIVLRILDKSISLKHMSELGFTDKNVATFRTLIRKPYGMILVTGPTGSGKTTTLYAALNELKQVTNNIMTCEDPIEYEIDGINQSQVHEKVGLTFATQLRAILRQDPDIILVGEIRDGETAQTAVRAALTGHLVLSTLHCNDAPSAIPRLLDMGVDPFLLSTSLIGVMSQRLLRCLCPQCKAEREANREESNFLSHHLGHASNGHLHYMPQVPALYEAKGCTSCSSKGYKGRRAVHEIMPVTGEVAKCISEQQSLDSLRLAAHAVGYRPMHEEALDLVLSGVTTFNEAERNVFFDSGAYFKTLSDESGYARAA